MFSVKIHKTKTYNYFPFLFCQIFPNDMISTPANVADFNLLISFNNLRARLSHGTFYKNTLRLYIKNDIPNMVWTNICTYYIHICIYLRTSFIKIFVPDTLHMTNSEEKRWRSTFFLLKLRLIATRPYFMHTLNHFSCTHIY